MISHKNNFLKREAIRFWSYRYKRQKASSLVYKFEAFLSKMFPNSESSRVGKKLDHGLPNIGFLKNLSQDFKNSD